MSVISPATEAAIVARLARGDNHTDIAKEFGIAPNTVTNIKNRQAKTLQVVNNKLTARKMRITSRILEKAHKELEKRLDESVNYEQLVADIEAEFEHLEDNKENRELRNIRMQSVKRLSVAELVTITKEMFHQSQVEQGKPTGITYNADAATTKEQLDQLLEAIQNGDDIKLLEMTAPKDD